MMTTKSKSAVVIAVFLAMTGMTYAEVLIGLAAPLSGHYALLGEQTQRGAEVAVDDLNQAGGVLGQKVGIINVDDFCDPEQAVAAARKLVSSQVVFVGGHQCSGAAIPASKVYEEADVIFISNAASNPKLTDEGGPNVFRVFGRDDQQAIVAGAYLAGHWRDKRIAIVHDGQIYGKGLAELTRQQLRKHAVSEVLFEAITPGQSDYSTLVARLQDLAADVVYFGGYGREAGLIIRQARDTGSDFQLVAGDGIGGEDFGLIADSAGNGTLMTLGPDPRNRPEAAPVLAKFEADSLQPLGTLLLSYATVQVWAQAAEKAGTFEPDPVIEALRKHRFDTVLGNIGFDEKGDVIGRETFVWYIWKESKYFLKQ